MDTQKEKKFEELSKLGVKHRTEERNGKLQLRSVFHTGLRSSGWTS